MSTRRTSIQLSGLALAILATLHGAAAAQPMPRRRRSRSGGRTLPGTTPTRCSAVSVVATGETRQVQTIGSEDIKAATPGTSALKVLNELPGVNFQSSDPWGAYEWSTSISLHGFDQSRLGFTLDGIPLGNMAYAVTNGLQVTRAISSDNLASVQLAQGAGALGTPSNTNLGGTVQFYSADPDDEAGRAPQPVDRLGRHASHLSCGWTRATSTASRCTCRTTTPTPTSGRATARSVPTRPT